MVYFALSFVGDYAREERTMPFEHLARSEVVEEPESVEARSDISKVSLSVEQKV